MKTLHSKPLTTLERNWYIVDASGLTLGRLATKIASVLQGKHKPSFSNHVDTGDYVVVLNADKFAVTGNKLQNKIYYKHSGWMGGLSEMNLQDKLEKEPTSALELAVDGMIPRNKLRKERMMRLKLYTGTEHPHAGQNPQPLFA